MTNTRSDRHEQHEVAGLKEREDLHTLEKEVYACEVDDLHVGACVTQGDASSFV